METKQPFWSQRTLIFISLFTLFGLLALQVPFTQLIGSKVKFTLFDFFAPIATGFIGTVPGVISVLLMQILNFLLHGAEVADAGTIIRFFPVLFGAAYFGRKDARLLAVPLLAIGAFMVHPIGRTVWYFPLFWVIPFVCHLLHDRSLFARSLGATFTAHAVGGAIWIHVFNFPASVWQGLIPTVIMERLLFALGIAAMYVLLNNVLNVLTERHILNLPFILDRRYLYRFVR